MKRNIAPLFPIRKNEALHSRIIVMPIPYNLKVTEEEKIYEKMISESDVS